jgi:hypothetical protein
MKAFRTRVLVTHCCRLNQSMNCRFLLQKSNNDSNSTLRNNNIIASELPLSQISISKKDDIATKGNFDNVLNESQITEHIEAKHNSVTKERSSVQSQTTVNKTEKHEWYSIEEKISPLESKYKQLNLNDANDFLHSFTA